MRLTRYTDYAMRVLLYLGSRLEKAFGVETDTLMAHAAAHELAGPRAREDEIVVEAA